MPDKQKSAQKKRTSRTSAGTARGAKPTYLTEIEKILIGNGGVGHRVLRQNRSHLSGFKMTSRNRRGQEETA